MVVGCACLLPLAAAIQDNSGGDWYDDSSYMALSPSGRSYIGRGCDNANLRRCCRKTGVLSELIAGENGCRMGYCRHVVVARRELGNYCV